MCFSEVSVKCSAVKLVRRSDEMRYVLCEIVLLVTLHFDIKMITCMHICEIDGQSLAPWLKLAFSVW